MVSAKATSGRCFSASAMPSGSNAFTRAPACISAGTTTRLGASRMSSVFGLKVRPSTAIVLPATEPPAALITTCAIVSLRRSLAAITASTIVTGEATWWAVRDRASVSLGKHEPP